MTRVTMTVEDGVADVRLARAEKLNALDAAMFADIAATIDRIGAMTDVRAVVLSGEGRGFCAGLDMAAMAGGGSGLLTAERTHGPANLVQHVAWGWRALPQPVIAALHGVALGGGLQIASGADIRIAHPETRLSVRELHWGIVPDMAGFALWRGTVRDDHLREAIYAAREFAAVEAERLGFVTRLADDPLAEALALARTIAGRSPAAIRAAKRLAGAEGDAATLLMAETEEQQRLIGTPEQTEQVRANMERRPARF
ncbi:crotonase/enoyl-CoA hydratase family protein [Microvirga sp. SRT01]|uniref:Crotonase/enoyl-CoA hydratase family protein n=1 Tax=Sphingomonas longa TaxID=2778730 RepID=A0ABS2D8Y7_9SPHN|nr:MULTISPECIES: crotonase/enoyl-CoA hydratase family protein [Alphaproteobacteria]MBM6577399.1 crotonase/enoyl-CoA hydratase family protein [Sphingomonas sp. BT552]MBR7710444.1 crotonase/enoyl-CoA hydratase family protein [Microvirga sp. SRT01]